MSNTSWIGTARARPKLLAVDDQAINIRIIHELFRDDYDIFMATNGEMAISKCQELMPDIILLDVIMPGIDGFEVCRRLKSDPFTAAIPIIFITAHFNEADEVRGFELGAADFIHKPINSIITRARVRNHLELKQSADELRTIALTDGLTGIANRHKFDDALNDSWQNCIRTQKPISILMLDVDFFKRFNDHYGHQEGDECLRAVAQTISATLQRPYDLAARYGGEEFSCILPQTDWEGAVFIAERILANINALQINHANSDVAKTVTLSIGVASMLPNQTLCSDDLIKAADEQLYLAKEAGRAQLVSIDLSRV